MRYYFKSPGSGGVKPRRIAIQSARMPTAIASAVEARGLAQGGWQGTQQRGEVLAVEGLRHERLEQLGAVAQVGP